MRQVCVTWFAWVLAIACGCTTSSLLDSGDSSGGIGSDTVADECNGRRGACTPEPVTIMSLVAELTREAAVPPSNTAYGGRVELALKEQYSETDGTLLRRYMEWEVTLGPFSQEESANPVTIAFFDAEEGERGDEILPIRVRETFRFSNKMSGETFVFDGSLHPWDVELDELLVNGRVYFAVFVGDVEALRGLVRDVP